MRSYLYVGPGLNSVALFEDAQLEEFTERHRFAMPLVSLSPAGPIAEEIAVSPASGVVIAIETGLPDRRRLRLLRCALRRRLAVYLHWPAENAVEVVDGERLRSFWRHWVANAVAVRLERLRERRQAQAAAAPLPVAEPPAPSGRVAFLAADYDATRTHVMGGIAELDRIAEDLAAIDDPRLDPVRQAVENLQTYMHDGGIALDRVAGLIADLDGTRKPPPPAPAGTIPQYRQTLAEFAPRVAPVAFPAGLAPPTGDRRLPGTGVYVRTDYWSQLVSGGSYGHTCYVAHELAKTTEDFLCLMGSRFPLLDTLGLRQEILRPPVVTMNEPDLLAADSFYYNALKARLETLRPAYIYERAVLGNYAAARLSRDLGIPYILEYNGSEIAMRRSFGGPSLEYEPLFLEAERLGFAQAAAISVISEHVRDDVLARGVDPARVLVNPNGVDCDAYRPGTAAERTEIRSSLGFAETDRVVGFIGTFGGWHGIDVLAAALPDICHGAPEVRFLLIGDGNLKPLILDAIREHRLQKQVVDVGRTDQEIGANLLKAADILVSPHSSHMRDSPFFGSPTKLFEYMAMGGGIVASDLEQLGEVLRPALRPEDVGGGAITAERAVLCRPGDVADFVAGVLALAASPTVAAALGRNARAAAQRHFSWQSHVARTWRHALGLGADDSWRG